MKRSTNKWLVTLLISILIPYFASCTREETAPPDTPNTIHLGYLDTIYYIASDLYFWSDFLPQISDFDFDRYNSPESMLRAFRTYSPDNVDRWSFAITRDRWEDIINGISNNFGIGFRFWEPDDLRIAYVQPNSSAGVAGLKRGYRILRINHLTPNKDIREQLNQEIRNANTLTLEVLDNDAINQHIVIRRTIYEENSILYYDVFQSQEKKIAYLNLFTFSIEEVSNRFLEVFNFFHIHDAKYLIVDLRYNTGGASSVMAKLANYMTSPNAYNKIMYQLEYNSANENLNSKEYFHEEALSFDFKKIYFITTSSTASASELLISSLLPYNDITIVGTNTHGKPVGSIPKYYANYVLLPIAFKVINKDGDLHGSFNGFAPDITMIDGVDQNWGINEPSISACINDIIASGNMGEGERLSNPTNRDILYENSPLIEDAVRYEGTYYIK